MQNNGMAKLIIAVLAIVCIALAVVFIIKNKPTCTPAEAPEPDYSYSDDEYSVSGGDITFEDNNTEEMDSIPNEEAAVSDTNA